MDRNSLEYRTGFDDGWAVGRWQGRNDVWNAMLICLGNALGRTCNRRQADPYLQAMECFLEIEKLSMARLKAKVDQAKQYIADCGMERVIRKLVRDHWKGRRPRRRRR